jgi:sugar fermentation stimulation protein A
MAERITISGRPLTVVKKRLIRARFVRRPTRFAAIVALPSGEEVWAHLSNPGRLTGVVAPGCEVLVDGPFPPPRQMTHSMLASKVGRVWVGTNTIYANRIFPTLLAGGLFPELEGAPLAAEVPHGRSRFDFKIGERFVEVKSVTLATDGRGAFPDAVSERASKHASELARLARRGVPTAIAFVAQRGDVESVEPADDIDPEFGRALRRAAKAGVTLVACALTLTPDGAQSARRVPVIL